MFKSRKQTVEVPLGTHLCRRIVYESFRPMDYILCRKIRERKMYPILNHWLRMLPARCEEQHLQIMDKKLLAVGFQCLVELQQQRIRHRDTIFRLTSREKSDHSDMIHLMEAELSSLEKLLEEYRKTCRLLDEFEKGEESHAKFPL